MKSRGQGRGAGLGRASLSLDLSLALFPVALALSCLQPHASNQGVTAGGYGGSLGAGAATAVEGAAFGQTPASHRAGSMGLLLQAYQPFGLDEVRVAEAAAWWDRKHAGNGLAWRQTGVRELFQEQAWEYRFAWSFGSGKGAWPGDLALGASATKVSQRIRGHRENAFWRQGLGLRWQGQAHWAIGALVRGLPLHPVRAAQYALAGPQGAEDVVWQAGICALGPGAQVLRVDMRKTGDAKWRRLASLAVEPHPSLGFVLGVASVPFQFSLGLRVSWQGMAFHQALRHHGELGSTWLPSFGFSHRRPAR